MKGRVDLNAQKIMSKVTNDRFGLFVASEWRRLLNPYVPRDTGTLMGASARTVDVKPFTIHYRSKYASYVYYGTGMNFQKKNPYATHHWDVAAAQAGQKNKLYRTINNALQSGKI